MVYNSFYLYMVALWQWFEVQVAEGNKDSRHGNLHITAALSDSRADIRHQLFSLLKWEEIA